MGITFVHVTHDQEEAMTMADTIAVMNSGRIEQLGAPDELYERPATAYVAGFLGISNLLPGVVAGPDLVRCADGTEVRVPLNGRTGRVAVGIRPEKLRLEDAGPNRLAGTVAETAYVGVATQAVVETALGPLTVFVQNASTGGGSLVPGASVVLAWDPEAAFVVDPTEED
jgi:spermidine/putrescine transport system ATP-binding protein